MEKAFTTIEVIVVIVIIGILSAIALTNQQNNNMALAAHQVLNHIRYTQHLAMSEHKFDPKDMAYKAAGFAGNTGKYYRGWWQIRFQVIPPTNVASGLNGYSVYSDSDRKGNIDYSNNNHKEPAKNPIDGLFLHLNVSNTCSSDVNLLNKYGITNISFSANCAAAGFTQVANDVGAIIFDEKGIPYFGIANNNQNNPYQYKLTTTCNITLTGSGGGTATIGVEPETGYAQITNVVENN